LVYLHFSGLPVDLWVVVLEPGITKDHALPSKAGDSEEHPFGVSQKVTYLFCDELGYRFKSL